MNPTKTATSFKKEVQEFDSAWEEFFKDKPKPRSDAEDRRQLEEFHHWYNTVRKQSDTGKTPVEMGSRIRVFHWDDAEEEPFVPLKDSLIQESEKTKKLKKLSESLVEQYAGVLGPIESSIAEYYLDHLQLKDADAARALRNFIADPFREFDFAAAPLEYEIQTGAAIGAQNREISLHELGLAVAFIIQSIENRDYIPGGKGYLNWVCAFLGYLDDESIQALETQLRVMGSLSNFPTKFIEPVVKTYRPDQSHKGAKH